MTGHIEDPREVRTSRAGGVADFFVVMGVAGTGKTEIARRLADVLGAPFVEADAFHSSANVERMRLGIGLTDFAAGKPVPGSRIACAGRAGDRAGYRAKISSDRRAGA